MHKRKPIVFTVVVLVLFGSIFYSYRQVTGASTGTIVAATVQPVSAHNNQPITEHGQFASFVHSSDYQPISADPPANPVLARYLYSNQQYMNAQLTIQINHLATGSLNDDGSYNFRNTTTERFHKAQQQFNGNTTVIFTDTASNGYSRVAYLQHGSLAASIALTSAESASDSQLQQELTSVLNSWQWR